jgi:hypothetical protein
MATAEAGQIRRTFHDSVRFPAVRSRTEVVITKRTEAGDYDEVWRYAIDPADPLIDRGLPARQDVIEVERHGDPLSKVDVLLLGDGYTAADCHTKFRADTRRLAQALFVHEPFKTRRNDFNIWAVCPPAENSGISRPSTGVYRRPPAGSSYDAFGAERYVLAFDNRAWRDIAAWAPYEFVTILANDATYGGGGLYNVFSTAAVNHDFANYLFVHEFAHHFAGLADEYYTSPGVYHPPARIVEPWQANVTATTDVSRLKWRDLLTPGVAVPTPWPKREYEASQQVIQAKRARLRAERRPEEEMNQLFREEIQATTRMFSVAEHADKVGLFQGANYDAQAFYRSEIDCVMATRNPVPFCRVCQRSLGETIDRHTGR